MPFTWTSLAQQLWRHLQQKDAMFALLRRIDSSILNPAVTLDQIIAEVLPELRKLSDATRASIYLDSDTGLDLLASTHFDQPFPVPRPQLPPDDDASTGRVDVLDQPTDPLVAALGTQSALLTRIYGADGQLGYLVVESDYPPEVAHFSAPDVSTFVSTVSHQLSLAVKFKEKLRSEQLRWKIIDEILACYLKPNVGFHIVCKSLADFLPTFQACAVDPIPSQQILIYKGTDTYLTVVATTGREHLNTRVSLDRSVCGRLIRENKSYLNIDPRDDSLYRPYLGTQMRSELALRVALSDGVIAIVNMETPMERAFKTIHVNALQHAAKQLAPVLSGLYARRDRTQSQRQAMLHSLGDHLESITTSFAHDLSGPLAMARAAVDEIVATVVDPTGELQNSAASVVSNILAIETRRTQLAADMRGFSFNENRSVVELMEAARRAVWPDDRKRTIDVEPHYDDAALVHCSLFLKEVFKNLLQNAAYWVDQRAYDEQGWKGRVEIHITCEQRLDAVGHIEPGLNQKVKIVVRDNGLGMNAEDIAKVFEHGFTKRKSGTGYGLFAAKEYVASLGGEIDASSVEREFFQVTIVLDQYNPELHVNDNILAFSEDRNGSSLPMTSG